LPVPVKSIGCHLLRPPAFLPRRSAILLLLRHVVWSSFNRIL
jgi:hypothetical protein